MSRFLSALLLLAAAFVAAPSAQARERILSYDSALRIETDGGLEVTERIRVRAEGDAIRRGIYRDFPTSYRDGHGNRVVVDFEMREVLRDGRPEPWFVETRANGVRINTGSDALLPVPGEFEFTLRYRTSRQLGFFDGHDELYWNAIGTGWDFAIEGGSVDVRLPSPVAPADMSIQCLTGPQGARGRACEGGIAGPGNARWRLSAPLQPREGLTIVLGFPKGLVAAPSATQRLWWLLKDNRSALIALGGLVLLLCYGVGRWRRHGRDPKPGPVVVEYDPPEGLPPSVLRRIEKNHADPRGFSADLLALAVAGRLSIQREKSLLKDRWQLQPLAGDDSALPPGQVALLHALSASGEPLTLDGNHSRRVEKIVSGHDKRTADAVRQRFKDGLYRYNGGSIFIVFAIAVTFSLAAIAFGVGTGSGLLLALPLIAAMIVGAFLFAFLLPAITPEGRAMRDRIAGFRRYLTVAEKQDLQRLTGPEAPEPALDAERFQFLLPYAVALEVEEAWTRKFTLAVGSAAVAATTASIAWYHGPRGSGIGDIAGLGKAVGSGLASQISASSTPPGSSSAGGGGGFSGGGGGGGGGGGR